jgi:hypothetical protein
VCKLVVFGCAHLIRIKWFAIRFNCTWNTWFALRFNCCVYTGLDSGQWRQNIHPSETEKGGRSEGAQQWLPLGLTPSPTPPPHAQPPPRARPPNTQLLGRLGFLCWSLWLPEGFGLCDLICNWSSRCNVFEVPIRVLEEDRHVKQGLLSVVWYCVRGLWAALRWFGYIRFCDIADLWWFCLLYKVSMLVASRGFYLFVHNCSFCKWKPTGCSWACFFCALPGIGTLPSY